MESTAQYWQPVCGALERHWKPVCQKREGAGPMSGALHLAQAHSNRGRKGRKKDFPDAERLIKRLVAQERSSEAVTKSACQFWVLGEGSLLGGRLVLTWVRFGSVFRPDSHCPGWLPTAVGACGPVSSAARRRSASGCRPARTTARHT